MSNHITIIIGLPGSGKTYLGKSLSKTTGLPFIDDCGTLEDHWQQVIDLASKDESFILADPKLCEERALLGLLDKLKEFSTAPVFSFITFANEPEVCIANVDRRDERSVPAHYIKFLSKEYNPPNYSRPCFRK